MAKTQTSKLDAAVLFVCFSATWRQSIYFFDVVIYY